MLYGVSGSRFCRITLFRFPGTVVYKQKNWMHKQVPLLFMATKTSLSNYKYAHISLNRVSCDLGVGDAVLHDRTICMVPADRQGSGGGVVYAQVPRGTSRHWAQKREEEYGFAFLLKTPARLRAANKTHWPGFLHVFPSSMIAGPSPSLYRATTPTL